jgi:hypothetical protein
MNVYPAPGSLRAYQGVSLDPIWQPPGQLTGTTTGDNAAPGCVGEYLVTTVPSPGVSLTTATNTDIAALTLSPGDWDVEGTVAVAPSVTASAAAGWVNNVAATPPAAGTSGYVTTNASFGTLWLTPTGSRRFSLSVATTLHLGAQATFASGTATAYGEVRARRMR